MSNNPQGELATCACGAVGGIIGQSGRFEKDVWFVIEHESGRVHVVDRVETDGEGFGFALRYMEDR